ncbi:FAD-dependent oxidoreductase [Pseudomonas sp. NW5]|uniref:FAD-dependent oxidoreductase n=1 Tax=Pseudomonas sp. NW5 TaxID=2934934 RepID=UPI0020209909|nr:FAD-dependent oxidoreductase [Pseudomonas sp. NW5]
MSADFDLLLAGAGHSHLGVLRRWARGARPAGRIALVCGEPQVWYSGMLPGLLAGRYRPEDCRIELAALCRAAQVEWIAQPVRALDAERSALTLADGSTLTGRWLSLNVGAQPASLPQQGTALQVLPVKPFATFLHGWADWQRDPQPLAILGGGAAGVELALALAAQVPSLTLFAGQRLLGSHPAALRRRALAHLQRAGVTVREACRIEAITDDALYADRQPLWRGTRLLLASGPAALPWLRESNLACDAAGFVALTATLQSRSHPQIFASGDCASLPGARRNGVHAVRQGPVLAENLARALQGEPLRPYTPQRRTLALLADGRGGALYAWGNLCGEARLAGRLKDWLDRRFIRQHRPAEHL